MSKSIYETCPVAAQYLFPKHSAAGELTNIGDWQLLCALQREEQEYRKQQGNPRQLECRLGNGHGFLR